ncbi:hypothetical protein CQA66_01365 [Helicobacter aurati]|uniref:Alpha/beta hydrolase n=2 Tax=Helicobacter aurati TaxID=137778 RepID=A0A3D8J906_9HELI|nr:hypothetical protein CQA66_01365 [Helicobacter aurati]
MNLCNATQQSLQIILDSHIDSLNVNSMCKKIDLSDKLQYGDIIEPQHIVIFIGGFCDSLHRTMFETFCAFIHSCYNTFYKKHKRTANNIPIAPCTMYTTFNCYSFLHSFLHSLLQYGLQISIIAHSWGAKNILRLCLHENYAIDNLLTLDCVGHFAITHRPNRIVHWENIFIEEYFELYHRSNLAALLGGAKGSIAFADDNIPITYPANHASVTSMLEKSKLFKAIPQELVQIKKNL